MLPKKCPEVFPGFFLITCLATNNKGPVKQLIGPFFIVRR